MPIVTTECKNGFFIDQLCLLYGNMLLQLIKKFDKNIIVKILI